MDFIKTAAYVLVVLALARGVYSMQATFAAISGDNADAPTSSAGMAR